MNSKHTKICTYTNYRIALNKHINNNVTYVLKTRKNLLDKSTGIGENIPVRKR